MNPQLPALAGILDEEMIRAWPIVSQTLAKLPGDLMGGTAVAVHLGHRRSTDLDYMARHSFDGYRLGQKPDWDKRIEGEPAVPGTWPPPGWITYKHSQGREDAGQDRPERLRFVAGGEPERIWAVYPVCKR